MDDHVLLVAEMVCRPEDADEFGRLLEDFGAACRAEDGCLSFEVLRSGGTPGRFVSIERYTDGAAFAAHRASEHFREVGLGRVMPLTTAREVRMYVPAGDVTPAAG
ncbi:putative quinol monooxygenase [Streptomyces sp. NPDC020983]|uniref:putative quinol monooxygenase n=1 Tax=Streptomyces sp. NPDC020983 TaxID=3365106 RepID=UPI0037B13097